MPSDSSLHKIFAFSTGSTSVPISMKVTPQKSPSNPERTWVLNSCTRKNVISHYSPPSHLL